MSVRDTRAVPRSATPHTPPSIALLLVKVHDAA